MSTSTGKRCIDDLNDWPTSCTSTTTQQRETRNNWIAFIIIVVFSLIALSIGVLMIFLSHKGNVITYLEVNIYNVKFDRSMRNRTSTNFISISRSFCNEIKRYFQTSHLSEMYRECVVDELRQGANENTSIEFRILFQKTGNFIHPNQVRDVILAKTARYTRNNTHFIRIGNFLILYNSLRIFLIRTSSTVPDVLIRSKGTNTEPDPEPKSVETDWKENNIDDSLLNTTTGETLHPVTNESYPGTRNETTIERANVPLRETTTSKILYIISNSNLLVTSESSTNVRKEWNFSNNRTLNGTSSAVDGPRHENRFTISDEAQSEFNSSNRIRNSNVLANYFNTSKKHPHKKSDSILPLSFGGDGQSDSKVEISTVSQLEESETEYQLFLARTTTEYVGNSLLLNTSLLIAKLKAPKSNSNCTSCNRNTNKNLTKNSENTLKLKNKMKPSINAASITNESFALFENNADLVKNKTLANHSQTSGYFKIEVFENSTRSFPDEVSRRVKEDSVTISSAGSWKQDDVVDLESSWHRPTPLLRSSRKQPDNSQRNISFSNEIVTLRQEIDEDGRIDVNTVLNTGNNYGEPTGGTIQNDKIDEFNYDPQINSSETDFNFESRDTSFSRLDHKLSAVGSMNGSVKRDRLNENLTEFTLDTSIREYNKTVKSYNSNTSDLSYDANNERNVSSLYFIDDENVHGQKPFNDSQNSENIMGKYIDELGNKTNNTWLVSGTIEHNRTTKRLFKNEIISDNNKPNVLNMKYNDTLVVNVDLSLSNDSSSSDAIVRQSNQNSNRSLSAAYFNNTNKRLVDSWHFNKSLTNRRHYNKNITVYGFRDKNSSVNLNGTEEWTNVETDLTSLTTADKVSPHENRDSHYQNVLTTTTTIITTTTTTTTTSSSSNSNSSKLVNHTGHVENYKRSMTSNETNGHEHDLSIMETLLYKSTLNGSVGLGPIHEDVDINNKTISHVLSMGHHRSNQERHNQTQFGKFGSKQGKKQFPQNKESDTNSYAEVYNESLLYLTDNVESELDMKSVLQDIKFNNSSDFYTNNTRHNNETLYGDFRFKEYIQSVSEDIESSNGSYFYTNNTGQNNETLYGDVELKEYIQSVSQDIESHNGSYFYTNNTGHNNETLYGDIGFKEYIQSYSQDIESRNGSYSNDNNTELYYETLFDNNGFKSGKQPFLQNTQQNNDSLTHEDNAARYQAFLDNIGSNVFNRSSIWFANYDDEVGVSANITTHRRNITDIRNSRFNNQSFFSNNQSFFSNNQSFFSNNQSFFSNNQSFFSNNQSFFSNNQSFFSNNQSFFSNNQSFFSKSSLEGGQNKPLIDYREKSFLNILTHTPKIFISTPRTNANTKWPTPIRTKQENSLKNVDFETNKTLDLFGNKAFSDTDDNDRTFQSTDATILLNKSTNLSPETIPMGVESIFLFHPRHVSRSSNNRTDFGHLSPIRNSTQMTSTTTPHPVTNATLTPQNDRIITNQTTSSQSLMTNVSRSPLLEITLKRSRVNIKPARSGWLAIRVDQASRYFQRAKALKNRAKTSSVPTPQNNESIIERTGREDFTNFKSRNHSFLENTSTGSWNGKINRTSLFLTTSNKGNYSRWLNGEDVTNFKSENAGMLENITVTILEGKLRSRSTSQATIIHVPTENSTVNSVTTDTTYSPQFLTNEPITDYDVQREINQIYDNSLKLNSESRDSGFNSTKSVEVTQRKDSSFTEEKSTRKEQFYAGSKNRKEDIRVPLPKTTSPYKINITNETTINSEFLSNLQETSTTLLPPNLSLVKGKQHLNFTQGSSIVTAKLANFRLSINEELSTDESSRVGTNNTLDNLGESKQIINNIMNLTDYYEVNRFRDSKVKPTTFNLTHLMTPILTSSTVINGDRYNDYGMADKSTGESYLLNIVNNAIPSDIIFENSSILRNTSLVTIPPVIVTSKTLKSSTTPPVIVTSKTLQSSTTPPVIVTSKTLKSSTTPPVIVTSKTLQSSTTPPVIVTSKTLQSSTTPPVIVTSKTLQSSTTPPVIMTSKPLKSSTTPPVIVTSKTLQSSTTPPVIMTSKPLKSSTTPPVIVTSKTLQSSTTPPVIVTSKTLQSSTTPPVIMTSKPLKSSTTPPVIVTSKPLKSSTTPPVIVTSKTLQSSTTPPVIMTSKPLKSSTTPPVIVTSKTLKWPTTPSIIPTPKTFKSPQHRRMEETDTINTVTETIADRRNTIRQKDKIDNLQMSDKILSDIKINNSSFDSFNGGGSRQNRFEKSTVVYNKQELIADSLTNKTGHFQKTYTNDSTGKLFLNQTTASTNLALSIKDSSSMRTKSKINDPRNKLSSRISLKTNTDTTTPAMSVNRKSEVVLVVDPEGKNNSNSSHVHLKSSDDRNVLDKIPTSVSVTKNVSGNGTIGATVINIKSAGSGWVKIPVNKTALLNGVDNGGRKTTATTSVSKPSSNTTTFNTFITSSSPPQTTLIFTNIDVLNPITNASKHLALSKRFKMLSPASQTALVNASVGASAEGLGLINGSFQGTNAHISNAHTSVAGINQSVASIEEENKTFPNKDFISILDNEFIHRPWTNRSVNESSTISKVLKLGSRFQITASEFDEAAPVREITSPVHYKKHAINDLTTSPSLNTAESSIKTTPPTSTASQLQPLTITTQMPPITTLPIALPLTTSYPLTLSTFSSTTSSHSPALLATALFSTSQSHTALTTAFPPPTPLSPLLVTTSPSISASQPVTLTTTHHKTAVAATTTPSPPTTQSPTTLISLSPTIPKSTILTITKSSTTPQTFTVTSSTAKKSPITTSSSTTAYFTATMASSLFNKMTTIPPQINTKFSTPILTTATSSLPHLKKLPLTAKVTFPIITIPLKTPRRLKNPALTTATPSMLTSTKTTSLKPRLSRVIPIARTQPFTDKVSTFSVVNQPTKALAPATSTIDITVTTPKIHTTSRFIKILPVNRALTSAVTAQSNSQTITFAPITFSSNSNPTGITLAPITSITPKPTTEIIESTLRSTNPKVNSACRTHRSDI